MVELTDVELIGEYIEYIRMAKYSPTTYRGSTKFRSGLEDFTELLKRTEIAVDIIPEVLSLMKKLDSKYPIVEETDDNKIPDQTRLSQEDLNDILENQKTWKKKIRNELETKKVIEMTLKSGLNLEELRKLANHESSLFFTDEIWGKLSDIEKNDYSDAARCLLLGTATPSVMVALRGAEASVRQLYYKKIEHDPESRTWRQLTSELHDKCEDLGMDKRFLSYIDAFGEALRNFAQHPNKIYTLREAVSIFMQVLGLVEEIYNLI